MYFVACFAGLQSVAAQNILCNVSGWGGEKRNYKWDSLYSPSPSFPTDDTISQRGFSYSYFPLHKKATNVFHFVLIFFVLLSLPWTGNAFFYRNEWISKFLFHIHPQSSSSAIYPYPPVHSGRGYKKFRRVKVFKPPLVSFKVFLLFDFYSQNDFWSGEVEHKNSIMIMKTTQRNRKR